MKKTLTIALLSLSVLGLSACNSSSDKEPVVDDHNTDEHTAVADEVIASQRAALETNTDGKGFGPQSPRNIDDIYGESSIAFTAELPATEMNLCNIHFHKNAEHKGW